MSDQSRSLPARPSLRFLKLEARRRLAAGEFAKLHDAQLAIAREHGFSSWAVLKRAIDSESRPGSHALGQVRWLLSRFRGARRAGMGGAGRGRTGRAHAGTVPGRGDARHAGRHAGQESPAAP